MKIHEYQARNLFRKYGIPVPDGVVCQSVEEVQEKIPNDDKLRVIKAQVHVGGRGKAGGVKLAKTKAEAIEKAGQILGMDIKGLTVEKNTASQCPVDLSLAPALNLPNYS